jgi:DNA-binding beta-propeller fold protein YncE
MLMAAALAPTGANVHMAQAQQLAPEDAATAQAIAAFVKPLPKLPVARSDLALPASLAANMGMISTMAFDPKAQVLYLLQRGPKADPIIAVDMNGHLLRSWGKGLYKMPHGVRIDPAGNIWTTDSVNSTVLKFSPQGAKLLEIDVGGQPAPGVNGTTDVAFGPDGHVFVADGYGNARILEYSADGKLIHSFGSHGTGPGQFNIPHAILIKDGTMYVADRENGRIQRFDLTGKFLGEWDGFGKPMTLAFGPDDSLVVGTGYQNAKGQSPPWLAWVIKIDRKTGKALGYVEVGDDAHAEEAIGPDILTGGETAHVSAVHWFRQGG